MTDTVFITTPDASSYVIHEGLPGPKGDQGLTGNVGPKGDQGVQGPTGATGATGPAGGSYALGSTEFNTAVAGVPLTRSGSQPVGQGELVLDATAYYGVAPSGASTDVGILLNYVVSVCPDGGGIKLAPGLYSLSTTVTNQGKSIYFQMEGATITVTGDVIGMNLTGAFDAATNVSSIGTTTTSIDNGSPQTVPQLTLASAPATTWTYGDVVKIVAEDLIPERRPNDGTTESRVGEFAVVLDATSATGPVLTAPLSDSYTSSPRVAKLQRISCTVRGGTWQASDTNVANNVKRPMFFIVGMMRPVIDNVTILRNLDRGFHFRSCFNPQLRQPSVQYLKNDAANTNLGYAVFNEANEAMQVLGGDARNVRHAYTDDSPRVAVGGFLTGYGRPRNAVVTGMIADGCNSMGFNTHQTSDGVVFQGCLATSGTKNGFGGRGKNGLILNCISRNNAYGAVRLITDTPQGGVTNGWRVVNIFKDGTTNDGFAEVHVEINNSSSATVGSYGNRDGKVTVTVDGGEFKDTKAFVNAINATVAFTRNRPMVRLASLIPANGALVNLQNSINTGDFDLDASANTSGADTVKRYVTSGTDPRNFPEPTGMQKKTPLVGSETFDREEISSTNLAIVSGRMLFTPFTCETGHPTNGLTFMTGTTAGSGTVPTTQRWGLFRVSPAGGVILMAQTADDLTNWAASTIMTKTWTTTVQLQAGQRYAVSPLYIGTGTPSSFVGKTYTAPDALSYMAGTWLSTTAGGQTAMPPSISVGSLSANASGRKLWVQLTSP